MRLLYIDIDTLRADHLGCYGYDRATSPNIDALATEGVRFDRVYVSDAPCLPSRSALATGRFGIRNGIVNHGGVAADLFTEGGDRGRQTALATTAWATLLRSAGLSTTTISTFAERHSAFHWYAGYNEVVNLGSSGHETADAVATAALDWLRRKGVGDDWFLHVHFWDPHTPYRTPKAFGDPFAGDDVPDWLTEEIRARHWELPGPHSAQEVTGFAPSAGRRYPRQPQQIDSAGAVRMMFDGYDTGILYADDHVGRLLTCLADLGVLDETAVMVSSDHGETLGELGIYCDHQTADHQTQRVPVVLRWPGIPGGRSDPGLRYQIDVAATVVQMLGVEVPETWDGAGFADELHAGRSSGRDHLVVSCGAWAVQRSARFADWLCIETYHDAYHGFPDVMLFDVVADPHQIDDQAPHRPEVVSKARALLAQWQIDALERSPTGVDPLSTVLAEGGGWYVRGQFEDYRDRLHRTGRSDWAHALGTQRPNE